MGKGDRRTKRGKLFCGTFGKFRPSKKKRAATPTQTSSGTITAQATRRGQHPPA